MAHGEGRTLQSSDPARVCTIAGSDSGGGAGIQADLKTIQAAGGYGVSVITALTAQNTRGVHGVSIVPPDFVAQQLQSVIEDIEIDAFKIGMLGTRDTVRVVAQALRARPLKDLTGAPAVLDPVMVSSSGSLLLEPDAIDVLLSELLPQCTLFTPNLPEASAILHHYGQVVPHGLPTLSLPGFATAVPETGKSEWELRCVAMLEAARLLASHSGAEAVLLKGGHGSFVHSEVEGLMSQLGVTAISSPGLAMGRCSKPAAASLLSDAEGLDAGVFTRDGTDDGEVSVVRTDLRPWTPVLTTLGENQVQTAPAEAKFEGTEVVADVLCEALTSKCAARDAKYRYTIVIKPLVHTTATHGTGCTLSSAIATHLAAGCTMRRAVLLGIEYVQGALIHGLDRVGKGRHPLNHSHALVPRAVGPRSQSHISAAMYPLTSQLIGRAQQDWLKFVRHPFVEQLGRGTLPLPAFKHFLLQDYLFLRDYARTWSLGASKADDFASIRALAQKCVKMVQEAELHVNFCASWGVSRAELAEQSESCATMSYTRFLLDVGRRYGGLELAVATLPCILGYTEVGQTLLLAHPRAGEQGNLYAKWIETYAHPSFKQLALEAVNLLEDVAQREVVSLARLRSLQQVFETAVKLEQGMWDEAMSAACQGTSSTVRR